MYPFTRVHPYETQEIIINDILKHFREVSGAERACEGVLDEGVLRGFSACRS